MASTGLLVVSNIKQLGKSLRSIEKYVNSLYIHLNVAKPTSSSSPPVWGRLISQLYADSSSYVGNKVDLRVLVTPFKEQQCLKLCKPVDMIFSDEHQPELCEKLRAALNISKPTIFLQDTKNTDFQQVLQHNCESPESSNFKVYPNVVLGGTFDRIHIGHKIFLTQAVLRTCKRLVIGVTTAAMTKSNYLFLI